MGARSSLFLARYAGRWPAAGEYPPPSFCVGGGGAPGIADAAASARTRASSAGKVMATTNHYTTYGRLTSPGTWTYAKLRYHK